MRSIPWSRRRTQLAAGAVLLGAVAALIASAVLSQGYPVQQVSLNDGGIWVTSDHDGLFGRLNKPAGELDAGFYPPGTAQAAYQLDILQDGAAVAAWDQGSGKLYPVDVDNAVTVPDQAVAIPSSYTAQVNGGTLATLDPATGQVRAETVDQDDGISNLGAVASSAGPLATVGSKSGGSGDAGSAMAVGVDGTVYAVSGTGRTATIQPAGSAVSPGTLGAPQYGSVGRTLGNVRVTAVGDQMVVLDDASGDLIVANGPTVHLDGVDAAAQLQAPSPQSGSVVVATSRALLSVNLASGQVTILWNSATGAPAAPVQMSGCVYAAWADTENGYVSSCDGIKAAPGNLADKQALVRPEFRQNRGQIVLNDLASGAVWDLDSLKEVDDWASVKPPPQQTPQNKTSNTQTDVGTQNQPPKAQDVTLGARPDRTTVLHLLDGCSDPGGNILSITALTQPDNQGASAEIAPDGQTALVTLTSAATGDVHFRYTVDDGKGMTASADVTVQVRDSGQNDAPNLRTGYTRTIWDVPSGGHISLPVLADWRDYDGDPLALSAVSLPATDGTAVATSDGFLDYTAPGTGNGGTQTITYQVSDGHGGQTGTTVQVDVQSPTSTKAIAPTAEPNVARGQVGQPIVVHPLQNAVPGFDPSNPGAQLALAGQVASPAGTTVGTDLGAGTITMTATQPGTFLLDYTIAFGNAPFGKGTIRVDVVPVPATQPPPVAMPAVAVLHGQLPATVDVLADDYDPSGALLAVQGASAVATDNDPLSGQLQVAVVDGRWLRINATSAQVDSSPRLVRYTITDGLTAPVTGEVSVTELPSTSTDTPVVVNGYATVRAGDSATIPVLDNDFDPDGATLTLACDIPGAPGAGQLRILSESGTTGGTTGAAYVTGTTIRYVAPAAVTGPVTVIVQYVVENALGNEATGQVFVTVDPPPSAAVPDRAPDPRAVQVRAVAGQTITIQIPTDGVDPDGDSVSVTGIASATAYGRVMSYNATTITYQAFPSSGGTDSFGYTVEDPYGATGTGTIQVAVVPPASPQPPVAVDDTVTAAPGARLAINVLSQDILTPGDPATLVPLASLNPGLPAGSATLSSDTGPIDVVVPPATGKPLVITYGITDGTGDPSTATLTVFPQTGYQTPPVALDSYQIPTPHATSVSVDVRPQLSDADSSQNPLIVSRAFDPQAQVSGGRLVLPAGPNPRTFAYEVKTPAGASTVGVVHVAGTGAGAPVAKPNTLITVPENGSTTVSIGDYVTDPAGKAIRLTTTDKVWPTPSQNLAAQVEGEQQIKLTASGGYVGPAALTFQVTDGTTLTDPAGHFAVITVQVQVGPQTPVLRCPTAPISLVEGGQPREFDVTSVCYVWTADPATAAGLAYTASWVGPQPTGVTVSGPGGHKLTITPGASSVPGSSGTLKIGVVGSPSASSQLSIQITAAAPPTVSPVTIDGIKAGQTATVNMAGYVSSELYQPVVSVVSTSQSSGMSASVSSSGSTVQITPNAASHGVMTFNVTVTDVPSHSRRDRQTVGQITLNVLGLPDAPGQPTIGTTVLSRAVQLSWPTPANNGAPIDSYQVSYSGGQQTCAASPCTITGLSNGVHYTFTVKAHNLVGWGKPSPASAVAVPNTIPDAVTGLTATDPQDATIKLAWNAAHDDGTPVLHYAVSWTGGGQATVSGTAVTATGLDNDTQYTFTVIAVNAQGPSPATTVQGQSAGAPAAPAAPKFTVVESADANSRAVTVSWPAVSPNGPGPTTYTLSRTGGSGPKTVCSATPQTSCDDDGLPNDGTVYTYSVKAANADVSLDPTAHTSAASPGTKMTATATPSPITNMTVTATGNSSQATVKFDAPASHGASSTVSCTDSNGSCGSWTFSTAGENGKSENIGNLTDGANDTVTLQDCNGSAGGQDAGSACDTAVSANVTAYGPMEAPKVTASASGTTVNWTVSVNPNGKAATATITHDGQTTTVTTSAVNGTWSYSGSDSMGYSGTDNVTLSVSSSGRATVTASGSATTSAKPALTVSRGALCNTSSSSDPCNGSTSSTPCTNSSCGYIHIHTTGFSGSYTCSFTAPSEGGSMGTLSFTGDQNVDTKFYYGYPGTTVTVTCGGVTDSYTWP